MRDLFKEAVRSLAAHGVRTVLSSLGILFGVAAVIGILSIGEGARREQEALIAQLGILNVQIKSLELPKDAEPRQEILRRTSGLSNRDVKGLRTLLPDLVTAGGSRTLEPETIQPRPEDRKGLRFLGVEPGHLAASPFSLVSGRPLREEDERRRARVVLLGEGAAHRMFGRRSALHRWIRLNNTWLQVVGVVRTGSGGQTELEGIRIEDRSGDVMLPLSTSMLVEPPELGEPELDEIQLQFAAVPQVEPNVDVVRRFLGRRHRDQPVYEMVVPVTLIAQSEAQQAIFSLVMGLIAGISLLVGGIGIMNIMLASVMERTKEIAIRLAVGASPRDIHRLFVMEACLISLFGGLLGIFAGFGVSWIVALFTGWATSVSIQAVVLATVVSTLEGLLFGYLPARRAARLQPAMAVRI
ncbi:MAG: ABC transporter permease [Myxococcota bacterium]